MNGIETPITVGARQVKARLPAGVKDGQTIRLRGKGEPGLNGGPAGDPLPELSVAPPERVGRKGRDLPWPLYTSDRAAERSRANTGGRRSYKNKKRK